MPCLFCAGQPQALAALAQQISYSWNLSGKALPASLDKITGTVKKDALSGSRSFSMQNKTASMSSARHSLRIAANNPIQTQPMPGFIQKVTTAFRWTHLSPFRPFRTTTDA
jgi:hypothetical protein